MRDIDDDEPTLEGHDNNNRAGEFQQKRKFRTDQSWRWYQAQKARKNRKATPEQLETRQYYNFGVVDDRVDVPEFTGAIDSEYAFSFKRSTASEICCIFGGGSNDTLRLEVNGDVMLKRGSWYAVATGIPVDLEPHSVVWRPAASEFIVDGVNYGVSNSHYRTLTNFGTYSADRMHGFLWDVDINGERFYPIDDGWSNNPVIRDTIGGQDGALINGQASSWVGEL